MNENDFAELSAGHALHALSPSDERIYLDALIAHPEWAGLADRDAETAAALAEGVAPVAPPIESRSQLLSAISASVAAGTSSAAADAATPALEHTAPVPDLPTDVVQTIERRNWSRGLFALVASIALLVGIGWGAGSLSQLWQTPAAVTALEQIERAPDAASAQTEFDGGAATVHWSQSLGQVVLVADGLPTLPADRTFELWYVRDATPISAGTFSADAGSSTAQLIGEMHAGDTIAVTVEQSGGSPDGSPTTDPLFAIPTA